ncbi:uncharacterized protein PSANT_06981 [Moesziomyces antarcticus]|uniref:Major facilitator superfamily (MFS) profile domain-containing protein n=1 Tax=Pseudozyma antarctica TaxID=84753 RepID=A0A5C3FYH6_PSEA2|nr:uncharacterized protein PSANT_06981 [Moesziomyces antarcticus]
MLLPESPRWLMSKGREEDALRSLARLHARDDTSDVFVRAELAEIKAQLAIEKGTSSGWSMIFNSSRTIRKVAVGVILQFSVQITGEAAIQYYAPTIFRAFGYSDSRVFIIQSINSIVALVGEAAYVLFFDRLGRRWTLINCNAVAGACFAVATALQARYPAGSPDFTTGAGYAFIAMIFIFNFAFSAGIGPLSWATLESSAGSTTSCSLSVTSPTRSPLADLPKTKGRTLEDMERFIESTPWIVVFHDMKIVSSTEREEELRGGVVYAPQAEFLDSDSHEDKYDGLKTSSHDHDLE